MSDEKITELRKEMAEIRSEMTSGFNEMREWRHEADIGMQGIESRGIWGHRQKIAYNQKKIEGIEAGQIELESRVVTVDRKADKIIYMAIGAATVGGALGGLVFTLITKIVGG